MLVFFRLKFKLKYLYKYTIYSGNYQGGQDTCQGDSGGGLYVFDSTINKYVVAGVTRLVF